MQPNKKKLYQTIGVCGGIFVVGTALIVSNSNGSSVGVNEKLNEEAKKATTAERLRANSLKPVELGESKISDSETQILETKGKNQEIVNYNPKNKDQELIKPTNESNLKEKKFDKNESASPWDIALSGKKTEIENFTNEDDIIKSENLNKNNADNSKQKDAEKFMEYVSTPGMVQDAVVHKVEAPSKNDLTTPATTRSSQQSKPTLPQTKFARLAAMGSQKLAVITGREQVAGRGQMFKAGTRVYALLPDKLTVTNGEKLDTSLMAFGSTEQKFPNNVTFVGQAQLNKSNRRVEILIDKCVNTRDDSPPIPCKAIVKDIIGDNGLSGKIYDPANWQLLIATAGTFLSTYVLGSLTTTVAQTGVTVDPTVANQVRQALASSVNSIATRLSDSINKSGTEITISPGAIVQIFFVDTTTTWNLN